MEWARHVGPMERDARIYIMMTTSFCATKTITDRLEVTPLLVTSSFHRMAAMIPKVCPKSLKRRGGRLIDLSQIWFLHPVHEASNRPSNYPTHETNERAYVSAINRYTTAEFEGDSSGNILAD